MGKKRRKRRPTYTAEQPLQLQVVVARSEPLPARWGSLSGPTEALIRLLPEYELSGSGRDVARVIKIAMGVGAIYLVTLGKEHWVFGLLGVLVGLATMVVPVSDVRKRRLLAASRRLAEPRERFVPAVGSLNFDGRKLTITSLERVWRSLRPASPPVDVVVGVSDAAPERVYLGLIAPTKAGKDAGLWFASARPRELPEGVTIAPVQLSGEPPGQTVEVEPDAWLALHEAFVDPNADPDPG